MARSEQIKTCACAIDWGISKDLLVVAACESPANKLEVLTICASDWLMTG